MSKYNITLTWQDDRWEPDPRAPNGIHTCAGWIARWERGKEYGGVIWRPTRAAAYSAARRECVKPIRWRLDVVVSGPDMETVGNMIDSLARCACDIANSESSDDAHILISDAGK